MTKKALEEARQLREAGSLQDNRFIRFVGLGEPIWQAIKSPHNDDATCLSCMAKLAEMCIAYLDAMAQEQKRVSE